VPPDPMAVEAARRPQRVEARVVIVTRKIVELGERLFHGDLCPLRCRTELFDGRYRLLGEHSF